MTRPMNTGNFLAICKNYAREYRTLANDSIRRNRHMNHATENPIPQNDIDAMLVDFINFMGVRNGVDYALYTSDIQ